MRKRTHCADFIINRNLSKASKTIFTIDVHSTGTANTFTARSIINSELMYKPSEGKSRILLVLDLEKGIKDHSTTARLLPQLIKTYSFKSIAYFS